MAKDIMTGAAIVVKPFLSLLSGAFQINAVISNIPNILSMRLLLV